MKDNFIRLLAVALLLLGLGATAKIMSQSSNETIAATNFSDLHAVAFSDAGLLTSPVQASDLSAAEPPADAIYATVEHMKVLPGKWDDYLEAEKVWKKIHQGRKQRGEIMDWFLFRCTYPNGTDAPYDYITVTHQTAKQLSAP